MLSCTLSDSVKHPRELAPNFKMIKHHATTGPRGPLNVEKDQLARAILVMHTKAQGPHTRTHGVV